MSFTNKFVKIYKALLPSPFAIAIVLSFFAFVTALLFGVGKEGEFKPYTIFTYWENGLWNNKLLVFAMQMMLMLVLGHVLALSYPVNKFINFTVRYLNTSAKAAFVVSLLTMIVALFNWGLGLIFGAILARKVAEHAQVKGWQINYPLIGAAGYSGMMVWHGGFSGSSLAKVAENGHLASLIPSGNLTNTLPLSIDYSQTVFSGMNITTTLLLLVIVPLVLYWIGMNSKSTIIEIEQVQTDSSQTVIEGADKIDHSKIIGLLVGSLISAYALYKMFWITGFVHFFTPNNINLLLLGLGLIFHQNLIRFLNGLDKAIVGAAGILIQFPLYFGIMGMMSESQLITQFSHFIAGVASADSLPFFTFLSAGLVNILVPSGGGQWAIQGPLLVQTAYEMGAPLSKNILAFVYGDQLTNMLQPFWALPLLGITGLKAKQILPYSLILFLIGLPIFLFVLWMY